MACTCRMSKKLEKRQVDLKLVSGDFTHKKLIGCTVVVGSVLRWLGTTATWQGKRSKIWRMRCKILET